MKKNYHTPELEVIEINMAASLLANSPVEAEDYGLGYGGVDEEGIVEPD